MALFVVRGLSELKRALAETSKEAPKELARANKRAANIVIPVAVGLAPKGKHEGGGVVVPIAKSIHAVLSPNKVAIVAGGKASPHAAGAEFGGQIPRRRFKGRKAYAKRISSFYGGRTVTHLKKQPYLLPAVRAKLADVVITYERMLDNLAEKLRRA